MTIFDQIREDVENGTRDYHWIGRTLMAKEFGETVELFNAEWSPLDEFEDEHKRRIARISQLERIALAAEKLANFTVSTCGEFERADISEWELIDDIRKHVSAFNSALAKLREASK